MANTEEKRKAMRVAQDEVNVAKDRLIIILTELETVGASREAQQLEKIIIQLEKWQNK